MLRGRYIFPLRQHKAADWVGRLRAAAPPARVKGNITLAEALDITGFEVYQAYLDEELNPGYENTDAVRASR
jgi:hypothetical protein